MQQPDKIDSQSGKPEMSSKNNKKKRRQKKKHNQKPIVSGTDCSQVEQDTCQDSIVTGYVAEKSNTGLEKTKNTAQTSLVTKTVVDKLETSLDGNVIKKPNNSFEGIKDAAENLTVTGNITKKSKCGLTKGILKNTSQSSIKTGNVTDKPNNSFEKIKNSTQNSKVTGNVTEKPNNGFEGIGTYAHRLDIFKKISNLLSVDNKWLIIALEKLLVLYDDVSAEKELRMQTMHLLLNHLETSDSEELMALLKICKDPFIHQAFEKYIVDGKTLRIENILLGTPFH